VPLQLADDLHPVPVRKADFEPGQSAERVEQLVTRKIEEKTAQNIKVSQIKSTSLAVQL